MSTSTPTDESLRLNPADPVEAVFLSCVEVYRQRSRKYTADNWDDNFRYIARGMRDLGFETFTAADAASALILVKEARQDAARKSGRKDFEDDSYLDSMIDDINYRVIRLALTEQEKVIDVPEWAMKSPILPLGQEQ